jgi:pyridinium-3,5-bisthiocarboxylic acid mononucleotide nickel chelatase
MMLYIDCVGGVAGDMLLAALVDAGADLALVNAELAKLGIPSLCAVLSRVERHAINCAHIKVTWGQDESVDHRGAHEHVHSRAHAEIRDLIAGAGFAPRVAQRSLAVFQRLAEVEGRIHGVPIDEVHFHEVGSEDSIADVVGVCVGLELLDVDEIQCSPLPLGRGFVRSAHGVLPLPAPATLELLCGVPIVGVDIEKELVTPTGAALVTTLASSFGTLPSMTLSSIGNGAGGRDLPERPNIVRVLIGMRACANTSTDAGARTEVVLLETNLDDCSPELVPDAVTAAMKAGALDVWTSPVTMKKGRPGFVLHALARVESVESVADALLVETSALGIRMCTYERIELDRSFVQVRVGSDQVSVKVGRRNGQVMNIAPEHDDCAAVAAKLCLPVKEVFARALIAARAQIDSLEQHHEQPYEQPHEHVPRNTYPEKL